MAESEQTVSIDLPEPEESVRNGQPEPVSEQPATQDSEPATVAAVMESPVAELALDYGIAANESSAANPKSAIEAVTTRPEGAAVEEGVPVVEEPQGTVSPTEFPTDLAAETAPYSESGSPESTDPGAVAEGETTDTDAVAAGVSETVGGEVPTDVESEPLPSLDFEEAAIPEEEQPENSEDSLHDTPRIPVEETAKEGARPNDQQGQPVVAAAIPIRTAFLPVQSARNRPGYTLRGLF